MKGKRPKPEELRINAAEFDRMMSHALSAPAPKDEEKPKRGRSRAKGKKKQ